LRPQDGSSAQKCHDDSAAINTMTGLLSRSMCLFHIDSSGQTITRNVPTLVSNGNSDRRIMTDEDAHRIPSRPTEPWSSRRSKLIAPATSATSSSARPDSCRLPVDGRRRRRACAGAGGGRPLVALLQDCTIRRASSVATASQ
jgi:hypothetical protein